MAIIQDGMSMKMSDFQFERLGIPQAGLHYDEHERICNTDWQSDSVMIRFMESLVTTQRIGYEQIELSQWEVDAHDDHDARLIAKRVRLSLRAFGIASVSLLDDQELVFCAVKARKIRVLSKKDSSMALISNKELFRYLKRMIRGDL
ncbi:TPA: hypothetical protein UL936_001917 [Stenotrophomonas maltophilia]|nr:hypothetical protein [Stenotrophomonas maltophilia]